MAPLNLELVQSDMSEEISYNHTGPFTRVSMLLRKSKLTADGANELTEPFENMASAKIIAQFGAKLDTMNATVKAQLEAQNAKYNALIGAIGLATTILSAVMVFT